ncbi:unnamed protein product [Hymenolepis diminuta]|uniref:Yippee domain-containing protein n=1 Tax=Hymenolepis diminuta TaxID=6216 RepID=A0A0R3S7M6_HYMDI|nr:unnamed protein product [Hymenolepis diminuta]VUZ39746.1 unnamed protein product [Hymenolepis diminuta]
MLSEVDLESTKQKNLDHHFSSTFPGFTAINRRRRITCKNCDLPVGYADITQAHIEFKNLQIPQECQLNSGERKFESVMIQRPINISVNPKRLGSFKISESGNPYMTWIMKDAEGNIFNADEVVCDGCGSSLGARITSFEQHPHKDNIEICQPLNDSEEKSQFYSLSIERVKIESLFRNVGMRELSYIYFGGECYFNEIQAIEESDVFSNNSKSWMRPCERVIKNNNSKVVKQNCFWPVILMDLVPQDKLPEGTLN